MFVFKCFKDVLVVGDEGNWFRFEVEVIIFFKFSGMFFMLVWFGMVGVELLV